MENIITVSASIVIYNENKETLKKVIESYLGIGFDKELIIIDNSPNNTLQTFCEKYKGIQYIYNNKNIGFARGHNRAFEYVKKKSDIHFILNPDIAFKSCEIENFIIWFYRSKNIVLAIPSVYNFDDSAQKVVRNLPTIFSLIKRKLNLDDDTIPIVKNSVVDVPFAHGCFMAFKTNIFKELSGFDERFFMYMEDVDIWIRAKKYGKTVINTNYKIYHEHRKGSSKKIKLLFWHLNSALKYFWKYK